VTGIGSVLVNDGKIASVSEGSWQGRLDGVKRLDANGASLFPGFIDTHCHPFEYGWLKRNVDLRGTGNITGLRLRLFARVQRSTPGDWVVGMGWDQESFSEGRMPNRSDIDDLSGKNPVVLARVCGHIALLNTAAIKALGLERMRGPEFETDTEGNLTGIVREGALEQAYDRIPRTTEVCAADLLTAEAEAARCGVTTLHAILSSSGYREELEALLGLRASKSLLLRYRVYIPTAAIRYVEEKRLRSKLSVGSVRLNGVKIYADGSLGARTAALRLPYDDDPGNSGMLRHTDEELANLVEGADSAGYQVIIHAIGDRAVEQAVEALSRVAGARNLKRHRIEHASLLPRDLLGRMARHCIRAAVQPLFITSDGWAAKRLGEERVQNLYPLKSMFDGAVTSSGGSDSPIEQMSPMVAAWAAMVRGDFAPQERLSLDEALMLYTSNANSNGFDDTQSDLMEGGTANLTLLDSDLEAMHPAMVRKVGVAATFVDGKLAYSWAGLEA